MRILLVEDDPALVRLVQSAARSNNFNVDHAGDGEEAIEFNKIYDYDLLVLNLQLRCPDGPEMLRLLRRAGNKKPILILSAVTTVETMVRTFAMGVDDYLKTPFDHAELIARMKAIVRRSHGHAQPVMVTGKLKVDSQKGTVEANGASLRLTKKEYQILELLSFRKGSILTRHDFLNNLYGGLEEPTLRVLDVLLCTLRRKIADACDGDNYIQNFRGHGYRLSEPLQTVGANHVPSAPRTDGRPSQAA